MYLWTFKIIIQDFIYFKAILICWEAYISKELTGSCHCIRGNSSEDRPYLPVPLYF